jgi:ADP-ribosylglycohydrolase
MLGAIIGDVIGSVHEGAGTKTKAFPLFVPKLTFTDDSVLTVAVAEWILTGQNLVDLLHIYASAGAREHFGLL